MGRLMSSHNLLSSLLIPIERLRGKVSHCRVVLLVQQFRGESRDEPEHSFARQTVCGRFVRIGNHDAVMRIGLRRLQGGGPILQRRCEGPCADAGAHHLGSSSAVRRRRQTSAETACDCYSLISLIWCRAQDHTLWHFACVEEPPQRNEQFAGERHDHGLALFARGDARLIPLCQSAVPSGGIESARRAGSCRDAPARCPSWRDPSPAVANHSRRVSR